MGLNRHQSVTIQDKTFELYLPNKDVQDRIGEMAVELEDLIGKSDKEILLVGILNGAFAITAELVKCLNISFKVTFIKIKSYKGTEASDMKVILGMEEDLTNKVVVLIDDIVDTTRTLLKAKQILFEAGAENILCCSLFAKKDNWERPLKMDIVGFYIPNDFIVGFGLDYNGWGRNLQDVYVVK
jgi:hypoxanthine phosphoribosyltransferase